MEHVRVNLGSKSYSIHIGHGILESAATHIAELGHTKVALISHSEIAGLHGKKLVSGLRAAGVSVLQINLADGELAKNFSEVERALSEMARECFDRSSLVVALGGGAVGDAAGFIASLYMRGIPYVQIPTTLLAMVDSSVGGKTAVNLKEGKNLVGAFHQPILVLADPDVLGTLPLRHLQASVAEIIKTGVIRDPSLLTMMARGVPEDWSHAIKRCCEIKASIVEADEFETTGLRMLLNFGHTIGHAVEACAGYSELMHGEAISIGMVGSIFLSVRHAGLSPAEAKQITDAMALHSLPLCWNKLDTDSVMEVLMRDKKFASGKIRFVLAGNIGDAYVSEKVTLDDIREAVEVCKG